MHFTEEVKPWTSVYPAFNDMKSLAKRQKDFLSTFYLERIENL